MSAKREMALVFNELKFAPRNSKLVSAGELLDFHGLYEQDANGIHLFKRDGTLDAYLVTNNRQGHFAVSASVIDGGKRRYMHSTSSLTDAWLGLDKLSYSKSIEAVKGRRFEDVKQEAMAA